MDNRKRTSDPAAEESATKRPRIWGRSLSARTKKTEEPTTPSSDAINRSPPRVDCAEEQPRPPTPEREIDLATAQSTLVDMEAPVAPHEVIGLALDLSAEEATKIRPDDPVFSMPEDNEEVTGKIDSEQSIQQDLDHDKEPDGRELAVKAEPDKPSRAILELPKTKEELLLKMDEVDSEIAKMEKRLQKLQEEEEAAAEQEARGGEEDVQVLPQLPEYRVGYQDRRGQQIHAIYLENQKKHRDVKRKQLMGRIAPKDVLEKIATGVALYTCPSELQSYPATIERHGAVRPVLVRELLGRCQKVKQKENKLRAKWLELNQKFRKKKTNRGGSVQSQVQRRASADSAGSASRGSSLRSALVARSSPRDMGVVRSDMEMAEILARIDAEEQAQLRFERNLAVLPNQILDSKEKAARRFISHNALVEDPVQEAKNHVWVNAWQEIEKQTFLDKFLLFPKNFRKIATYLPYKSANDCSEYYYRTKKELDLKSRLRDLTLKKKAKAAEAQASKNASRNQTPKGPAQAERRRRGSSDEGQPHGGGLIGAEERKQGGTQPKRSRNWTEADKTKFFDSLKEHGKNWRKLATILGVSQAEVRGLYTTWKDTIDPMLNAVARERKRRAAELKAEAEARDKETGNEERAVSPLPKTRSANSDAVKMNEVLGPSEPALQPTTRSHQLKHDTCIDALKLSNLVHPAEDLLNVEASQQPSSTVKRESESGAQQDLLVHAHVLQSSVRTDDEPVSKRLKQEEAAPRPKDPQSVVPQVVHITESPPSAVEAIKPTCPPATQMLGNDTQNRLNLHLHPAVPHPKQAEILPDHAVLTKQAEVLSEMKSMGQPHDVVQTLAARTTRVQSTLQVQCHPQMPTQQAQGLPIQAQVQLQAVPAQALSVLSQPSSLPCQQQQQILSHQVQSQTQALPAEQHSLGSQQPHAMLQQAIAVPHAVTSQVQAIASHIQAQVVTQVQPVASQVPQQAIPAQQIQTSTSPGHMNAMASQQVTVQIQAIPSQRHQAPHPQNQAVSPQMLQVISSPTLPILSSAAQGVPSQMLQQAAPSKVVSQVQLQITSAQHTTPAQATHPPTSPAEQTAPMQAAHPPTSPAEQTAPMQAAHPPTIPAEQTAATQAAHPATSPAEQTAPTQAAHPPSAPAEQTAPTQAALLPSVPAEQTALTQATHPPSVPAEQTAPTQATHPPTTPAEQTAATQAEHPPSLPAEQTAKQATHPPTTPAEQTAATQAEHPLSLPAEQTAATQATHPPSAPAEQTAATQARNPPSAPAQQTAATQARNPLTALAQTAPSKQMALTQAGHPQTVAAQQMSPIQAHPQQVVSLPSTVPLQQVQTVPLMIPVQQKPPILSQSAIVQQQTKAKLSPQAQVPQHLSPQSQQQLQPQSQSSEAQPPPQLQPKLSPQLQPQAYPKPSPQLQPQLQPKLSPQLSPQLPPQAQLQLKPQAPQGQFIHTEAQLSPPSKQHQQQQPVAEDLVSQWRQFNPSTTVQQRLQPQVTLQHSAGPEHQQRSKALCLQQMTRSIPPPGAAQQAHAQIATHPQLSAQITAAEQRQQPVIETMAFQKQSCQATVVHESPVLAPKQHLPSSLETQPAGLHLPSVVTSQQMSETQHLTPLQGANMVLGNRLNQMEDISLQVWEAEAGKDEGEADMVKRQRNEAKLN